MGHRRVAIGGTFACDEALAVPLQYLLANAVWNVSADIQWLAYGSLVDFGEWSAEVLHVAHPPDLVVFLVRLSDLEAAHPELSVSTTSADSPAERNAGVANDPIEQFLCDLGKYNATNGSVAPLVVLLCPCAPSEDSNFELGERKFQRKIDAMQNVHMRSSGQLMDLFQQQHTCEFYDAVGDKRQHSPYTQEMFNVLSLSVCRQVCRLFRTAGSQKKVIVLDCDNTLWGGAVAEVGAQDISLTPNFLALQRFVVAQQRRGMLLALCSKNIHQDVAQAFEQRSDMVLDLHKHVVATKINWRLKSENIAELAKELSLGLDSFIFIDDNPLECDEVKTALPSVTVINLESDFSATFLDQEWVFDKCFNTQLLGSKEDSQRTQLYRENRQRQQLRESSLTHKAFLSALGVKIVFEELHFEREPEKECSSFTRALQLHHRTNQFNTSTTFSKRLTEGQLIEYILAPGHRIICAHVTDRFGHYGLVNVALCRRLPNRSVLRVDSFLLSCRALNRGVEHAMMRKLGVVAATTGAVMLEFAWEPTERNQPAYAFFSQQSDVIFAQMNDQDKNLNEESQRCSEMWTIPTEKATEVIFLKSADTSLHNGAKAQGLIKWFHDFPFVQRLRNAVFSAMRSILSSFLLQWMAQLVGPLLFSRFKQTGPTGLLRISFRNSESLSRFVAPALCQVNSVRTLAPASGDNTESNEDDKFRRKARQLTKLALVKHAHDKASSMIWSANRSYAAPLGNGNAESLQVVCESPQCSTVIQRGSLCAFQRCRNCCYRIQRLLTRSLHHDNADARQSAVKSLRADFAIDVAQVAENDTDPNAVWCEAHQNKRRRGEICSPKPSALSRE